MNFSFNFLSEDTFSNPSSSISNEPDLITKLDIIRDNLVASLQSSPNSPQILRFISCPENVSNFPMTSVILNHADHNESFQRVSPQIKYSIDKESDLIPGFYEGGLKLWECSKDLVLVCEELERANQLISPFISKNDCRVIELGAGHGLPAIKAWKMGYENVTVSDFNQEVITGVTWPNLYHNCYLGKILSYNYISYSFFYFHPNFLSIFLVDSSRCSQISCLSGDWLCHSAYLMKGSEREREFDLILSAETLYSQESTEKIFYYLYHHLSLHGIALLANKRFYFGVGGGTDELERILTKNNEQRIDKLFKMEVIRSYQDGKSNIRDIIKVIRIK